MSYVTLFGVAVVLMILGLVAISRAKRLRHESGLPAGRLIYADSAEAGWQPTADPLYSPTYHLIGKPDYLVETPTGIIPVEVKSAKAPALPYLGHLLQLAAYCLLVEETTGQTPPHGLLKYADALYEVDFTPDLRRELLDTLAAMREAYTAATVARNHRQAGKCLNCGFFERCEERLQGE